jgi:hypothetical protein
MLGPLLRVSVRTATTAIDALGLSPRLKVADLFHRADTDPDADPDAIEPLQALLDSVHADLALVAQGRVLLARRLVEILRMRARVLDRHQRGGGASLEKTGRPIVVTGFPRTGTTLAHRVLAAADDALTPTWCETIEPCLEGRTTPHRERRRRSRRARLAVGVINRLSPGLQAVHELLPDGPEECTVLHELALDSESFALLGPVAGYRRWLDERDDARRRLRYEWQAKAMASILADRDEAQRRGRWVLKAPQHLLQLDDLLAILPDALVVRMHRDPVAAMASVGSLVAHTSRLISRGLPAGHGEDLLQTFVDWQRRGDEGGDAHPGAVLDVRYDDLVADPVGFVEHVHAAASIPVSGGHLDAVRRHLQARPRHHFGIHRYTLADLDLDESEVRNATSAYAERLPAIPGFGTDNAVSPSR